MALQFKSVSVTATAQTIGLEGRTSIGIKNDGTNTAYFRLFSTLDPEPSAASGYAATTANASLTSSDPMAIFNAHEGWRCISLVCDTAQTATVRLFFTT